MATENEISRSAIREEKRKKCLEFSTPSRDKNFNNAYRSTKIFSTVNSNRQDSVEKSLDHPELKITLVDNIKLNSMKKENSNISAMGDGKWRTSISNTEKYYTPNVSTEDTNSIVFSILGTQNFSESHHIESCENYECANGNNTTVSEDQNDSDHSSLSFGQTYVVTKNSRHSHSMITSSSFALNNHNSQSSSHELKPPPSIDDLILDKLSREYDSVILSRNEPMAWNIQNSTTCVNKHTNKNTEIELTTYRNSFKICKRCEQVVIPGQAKYESNGSRNCSGLIWHKNCFKCCEQNCQKQLHKFDHILFCGKPYCFDHYLEQSKALRCGRCGEFIVSNKYTQAKDRNWHLEHFTCGNCANPIVDSRFILIEKNNVMCLVCHQESFKKNCQSCGQGIEHDQRFVQNGKFYWHYDCSCLECETCANSLIGRSRFYRKNDQLYCNLFCAQQRGPP